MKKIIMLVAALGTLAVAGVATAQSTGRVQSTGPRHACAAEHWYLGAPHYRWSRGTPRSAADETLAATPHRYGSGSCNALPFGRWSEIMNTVFEHQGHGSFAWKTIKGTWTHIKTVEVPDSCGDDNGAPESTPYGLFALRVSFPDGELIDTATVKLRLAC